ncbi:MAG TPA: YetF domain-containing protein [Flavisolibacter sp.]|jgi:uncharacterized membrane protein YcaP (DUF421 family)|nr:YetF domain-containing protein [Flavisolibacter sp.]
MERILLKIEWKELLLGSETWSFLPETMLRTFVMFLVIMFSLRLLGKRGIKQLSVFELGVIIGLGSAAGDPMFYKDVGLLPGFIVFAIVLGLYRLITFFINRSHRFEEFMEGDPVIILKDGCLQIKNFNKEPIAQDEFYAQLRLNCVSHLGQVRLAILETNGEVSIFYFQADEVKYGLPIIPEANQKRQVGITDRGHYACATCGYTAWLEPAPLHSCPTCRHKKWVHAINEKRLT